MFHHLAGPGSQPIKELIRNQTQPVAELRTIAELLEATQGSHGGRYPRNMATFTAPFRPSHPGRTKVPCRLRSVRSFQRTVVTAAKEVVRLTRSRHFTPRLHGARSDHEFLASGRRSFDQVIWVPRRRP